MPNTAFFLELSNGSFVHGRSDAEGATDAITSKEALPVKCYWGKEARKRIAKIR